MCEKKIHTCLMELDDLSGVLIQMVPPSVWETICLLERQWYVAKGNLWLGKCVFYHITGTNFYLRYAVSSMRDFLFALISLLHTLNIQ